MKARVVYRLDGSVAIIHPAPKSRGTDEAEKEWLERVFTKAMQGDLAGLPYDDINESDLPSDRSERLYWRGQKGEGITINKIKAQNDKKARDDEALIQKEIRRLAVESLKAQGLV